MLVQQAAQQYRQEDRERFVQFIQQEPMAAAQLRAPLYEDKVVDFLFDKATITDREVTREELEAAIEAEEDTSEKPTKKATAKKAPVKKAEAKPAAEKAEKSAEKTPAAKAPAKKSAAPKADKARLRQRRQLRRRRPLRRRTTSPPKRSRLPRRPQPRSNSHFRNRPPRRAV